ncbi:MAG TPA: hypothetical protein DCZ92_00525 [Elusimicrobia bacterium]|nr:MAG: hypothetical protein A2016_09365 [Elusimicrobia bacterium GWF2_62_30]HBA59310.1 hypothetical protein [Elusimicrobiota bacterium]
MASYYKKLKTELDGAAAAGLITPEQAGKVWDRAYASRTFASFKAAHWIAAISGFFISIGIILVVSYNWDKISAETKIAAFLLVFGAVAYAAMKLEDKPAAAIPLETLWFFMPVLGIGLYAQIFNLSGDPVKPYLVWAALSIPPALLLKRNLNKYLCSILLFAVLYWGTLGSTNMLSLTASYRHAVQPVWHWLPALLVLAAGFALYPADRLRKPLGAGLIWLFLMLAADTAIKLKASALLLLAAMSLSVLWLLWGMDEETSDWGLPLTFWTGAVYMMTFFWHYKPSFAELSGQSTAAGTLLVWTLFSAALLSLIFLKRRLFAGGKDDYLGKGLLAASMLGAFLLFGASEAAAKLLAVIANFILAAFGLGCILNGAKTSSEKMINRGVAVITLTAITRFVDIFGGLLKSGVAFIITGLAFAALAYFVNRGRMALIQSVKK